MRIVFGGTMLIVAFACVVYALQCLYVMQGYRAGNVCLATAVLTNHSVRRRWYDRQRWYELRWTGYVYTYRVNGQEYVRKGGIYANADRLPGTVRIAYQSSDPANSFIPELCDPEQMRQIALCVAAAVTCLCCGGWLLMG